MELDDIDRRPGPIIHVVPKSPCGGALAVVSTLVEAGHVIDRSSRVILLKGKDDRPVVHSFACPVDELYYELSVRHPIWFLRTAFAIARIGRHQNASLFHAHSRSGALVSMFASRLTGIPVLVHQHDAYSSELDRTFRNQVLKRSFSWLAAISDSHFVAVSYSTLAHVRTLLGATSRPISVVANGVDVRRFRPRPWPKWPERFLVGTAARLVPGKGVDLLIDAVALLRRRDGIDVYLAIAGDGSERVRLLEKANQLEIDNMVDFRGIVADMASFYRELSVFVLPSWSEGLPITVLEALSSGVPVVATAVGALEEVLSGGGGVCVPPGDSVALAVAIRELLLNESKRAEASEAARRTVTVGYSVEIQLRGITKIQDDARQHRRAT